MWPMVAAEESLNMKIIQRKSSEEYLHLQEVFDTVSSKSEPTCLVMEINEKLKIILGS